MRLGPRIRNVSFTLWKIIPLYLLVDGVHNNFVIAEIKKGEKIEMEKKKVVAVANLLMVLLASFALVTQVSPQQDPEEHRYVIMGGEMHVAVHLVGTVPDWWGLPFPTRSHYLTSMLMGQNITFSDPDPITGVVNLTVPVDSYVGVVHTYWDYELEVWLRFRVSMGTDGYGWVFTGNGTSPILGDVDCYTFNNDTGVYWDAPGDPYGFNGTLAALTGELPDPGPDGVAGTSDDGFGDGTPDPVGSSILCLNTTLFVELHDGTAWNTLFEAPWPQVMTTAVAYDIINEPASVINGANSTEVGEPWEFLAGLDHPGKDKIPHTGDEDEYEVPYGHAKWNAYVTYACVWSALNVDTIMGDLDIIWQILEKKVREDCVIGDVNCDEKVNIKDIGVCGKAFGARDEGIGPDGIPWTDDDMEVADPNFDARGDLIKPRAKINIKDIGRIGKDFGAKLTPDCIIRK